MNKLVSVLGAFFAAAAVLALCPSPVKAGTKNVNQILSEGKAYKYNLDQKGKKESIKVTDTIKEHEGEFDHKVKVTVNGEKIYSKTIKNCYTDWNPIKVMVTDTDTNDKQMELLILENADWGDNAWTADLEHIYYYQYANGKAKRKQDLAPLYRKNFSNIFSLHGVDDPSYLTTDGKGTLCAKLCLEVKNFDYVHIARTLQLKKGKFKLLSTKSYDLFDAEESYCYFRPKKNTTVYTKPGGKTKAFSVKKKEKIYLCGLYRASAKKIYLKVKNKSGKVGYIDPKKVTTYDEGSMHI